MGAKASICSMRGKWGMAKCDVFADKNAENGVF